MDRRTDKNCQTIAVTLRLRFAARVNNNISVSSHHQSSRASTGHVYEAVTSEMIANHYSDHKIDLAENVAYEFVQPKIPKFVETP